MTTPPTPEKLPVEAGQLPWSDAGRNLMLAIQLLIRENGGAERYADDIESENVKSDWQHHYYSGNAKIWTVDEDLIIHRSILRRNFPVVKGRTPCAVRNRMQKIGLNTKGLFYLQK